MQNVSHGSSGKPFCLDFSENEEIPTSHINIITNLLEKGVQTGNMQFGASLNNFLDYKIFIA